MKEFSIPQRIWRALYPTLLYFGISNVVSVIAAVIFAVVHISSGANTVDPMDIGTSFELAQHYIVENILIISLFGYIAVFILFIPMWLRTKKLYPRWNGGRFSLSVALCSAGAAIGLNTVLSIIISVTRVSKLFESYDVVINVVSSGSLPTQIIAAGLIAPIAEELCFRGVTLSRLSSSKLMLALVAQAVLFGVLHLNVLQGVYAALLGIFLGLITIHFRNIIYAIIAHISFNLLTVLLSTVESEIILTILGISSIIIMIISIFGLIKIKKPEKYTNSEIEAFPQENSTQ